MTTATGEKLGKSAGNSVWLDAALTSHYDFYQCVRPSVASQSGGSASPLPVTVISFVTCTRAHAHAFALHAFFLAFCLLSS